MHYYPDSWVVLKITPEREETIYKVLAGWSGGYLDGDSWRMNSGITGVDKQAYHWEFYGSSGSTYICHQSDYRISMATGPIYTKLKQTFGDDVELMPEDTDWASLDYSR
jgi:hypothetical protein